MPISFINFLGAHNCVRKLYPIFCRRRIVVLGLVFYFVLFGSSHIPEVQAKDSDLYEQLKVFTDVIEIVRREYVQEVDNKKLVEGAIRGMLSSLDPHSNYLDPEFYKELQVQTKGEFGGLGIEITIRDGVLTVVSPMEGSPADRAGIKSGDAIIKIDGKFTKDLTFVDAVRQLRGPKGTTVKLVLQRQGSEGFIEVGVVRDDIVVKSIRSRYLGNDLGYVRITQFAEKTADDLKETLDKLRRQTSDGEFHGLVLDVRNNPGGLLNQAVMVSDLFIEEGLIVYTDGRVKGQQQRFYAHSRGTEPAYPIVVLVNGGSASAAEIVAGCLKDHGRAIVVGTRSFGKGSVQTITQLENKGAITLTTALYYTKSGRSIQLTGVSPDVEVKNSSEENLAGDTDTQAVEADLPGALANPSETEKIERQHDTIVKAPEALPTRNPETVDLDEWTKIDPQFQKAKEILLSYGVDDSKSVYE